MEDRVKLIRASLVAAVLIGAFAAPSFAQRREADRRNRPDRYWAMFRDGTVMIGKDLREWNINNRAPSLNGKLLFDANNPLRLLRDITIQSRLNGPYVEFANGDILPGQMIGGMPADPSTRMPAHLLVAVELPLQSHDRKTNEIAIRAEHVARVVRSDEARGPLEPGTLHYVGGKKVKVKAIKWALGGVKALTEEGSITVGWLELAEIHPPGSDAVAALLDDALAPTARKAEGVDALLGRVSTSKGAVLTYRRAMLRTDSPTDERGAYAHSFQPAWALQAIRVPIDEIVTRSYREPNELPLSALPGEALLQKSATGFTWPWRRNASVRGAELTLGSAVGDLGVGTHSYTEVAFNLPENSKQFSATVGISRGVGNGGCAKVKVFRDKVGDKPLWESGFLRGGDSPLKLGPIDVSGTKKLILVTDFGHDGRPRGADPLDIRDEVDWLWPSVTVDLAAGAKTRPAMQIEDAFPQLSSWTISDELRKRITLRPFWDSRKGRWIMAMTADGAAEKFEALKPYEITLKLKVTQANAWLSLSAGRDDYGQSHHDISVWVAGKQVMSMWNNTVITGRTAGEFDDKLFSLGEFAGKDVTITLKVSPVGNPGMKPAGLILGEMWPGPIVASLPDSGATIKPAVPITGLKPTAIAYRKDGKRELQPGKHIDGKPLTMIGWTYTDGYGMPTGDSTLTYALDPSWTKFVAVVGRCSDDTPKAGPFEVLLDDKVVWRSGDAPGFTPTDEPVQLEVDIPEGHKTITLRLDKKNPGGAAWADAGFMKK